MDTTLTVRHFSLTKLTARGAWHLYRVEDTRALPGKHVDRVRTYAVRAVAPGRWQVLGEHRAQLLREAGRAVTPHVVRQLADGGYTCTCPAGRAAPRFSTTTTVDPIHGSCVHRDAVVAHGMPAAQCHLCNEPMWAAVDPYCLQCQHAAQRSWVAA